MLESRDWINPTFAGQPRLQKPPLAYWADAAMFALAGRVDEQTARIPSALAALVLVLLVSFVANRWFGARAGLAAGVIQATTLWTVTYGKSALVDMVLALLVAIAIVISAWDRLWTGIHAALAILAFWVVNALIVLAKGPVGLVFVVPTVLAYRFWRLRSARRPTDVCFVRSLWHLPGIVVFILLAGWWFAWIVRNHPVVCSLWFDQSLGRFASHFGPQTRPWYYYLYQVPLLTLPWAPLWLIELWRTLSRRGESGRGGDRSGGALCEYRLLWLWFGIGLGILTFSAGKREHYILPALTPLSVLGAMAWVRMSAGWTEGVRVRLAATVVGCIVAIALVFDGIILPLSDEMTAVRSMFDRQSSVLRAADALVQYGSGDNATEFFSPRRILRTSDIHVIRESVEAHQIVLILGPENRLADLACVGHVDIIDRAAPPVQLSQSNDSVVLAQLSKDTKERTGFAPTRP